MLFPSLSRAILESFVLFASLSPVLFLNHSRAVPESLPCCSRISPVLFPNFLAVPKSPPCYSRVSPVLFHSFNLYYGGVQSLVVIYEHVLGGKYLCIAMGVHDMIGLCSFHLLYGLNQGEIYAFCIHLCLCFRGSTVCSVMHFVKYVILIFWVG